MPSDKGYEELRKAKEMLEQALSVVEAVLGDAGEAEDEAEESDEMDNGSYSEGVKAGEEDDESSDGEDAPSPNKKAMMIAIKIKNRKKGK